MDESARQLGVDRFELRRRNLIRVNQLPYRTISHLNMTGGDFAQTSNAPSNRPIGRVSRPANRHLLETETWGSVFVILSRR